MNKVPADLAEFIATSIGDAFDSDEPMSVTKTYTYKNGLDGYVKRTMLVEMKELGRKQIISFKMTEKYPRKVVDRIVMDCVQEVSYNGDTLIISADGWSVMFDVSADE